MEAKINDLRDQVETIKAEKSRLEKQIEVESEVIFLMMFYLIHEKHCSKLYAIILKSTTMYVLQKIYPRFFIVEMMNNSDRADEKDREKNEV